MIKRICLLALLTLAARAELTITNTLCLEGRPIFLAWDANHFWTNDIIRFHLYFKAATPPTVAPPMPPLPPGITNTPPPKLDGSEIIWATFTPENYVRPESTNYIARIPSDLPSGTNLLCLTAVNQSGIESDPSNTVALRVLRKTGPTMGGSDVAISTWEEFHVIDFTGTLLHVNEIGGLLDEVIARGGLYIAKPEVTGFWFNADPDWPSRH